MAISPGFGVQKRGRILVSFWVDTKDMESFVALCKQNKVNHKDVLGKFVKQSIEEAAVYPK